MKLVKKNLILIIIGVIVVISVVLALAFRNDKLKTKVNNSSKVENSNVNNNNYQGDCDSIFRAEITVKDTKDIEEIAKRLMNEYLKHYQSDAEKDLKLKEYKINDIKIQNNKKENFEFFVDFSVKPFNIDSWLVTNGKLNGEWIDNKNLFIKVIKNNDTYKIVEVVTSPMLIK